MAFPFGSMGTLVAAVPRLMQFYPHESLVCVVLSGGSAVLRVTARLDVPDSGHADSLSGDQWWSAIRDIVHKVVQPGDLVHVVLFSQQPSARVLNDVLRVNHELIERHASLGESVWVRDSHWSCLSCAHTRLSPRSPDSTKDNGTKDIGCDESGWPVHAIEEQRARMLLGASDDVEIDRPIHLSRADLVAELTPLRPILRVRHGDIGTHVREIAVAHAIEHLTSPHETPLSPRDQELIVSALMDVRVRDTVIWDLAHCEPHAWRSAVGHLRTLVVQTRMGARAATATILAVWRWQLGDGTRAHIALDAALEAEPTYRLAHLLRAAVDSGMPPHEWREGLLQLERSTCLGHEGTAA